MAERVAYGVTLPSKGMFYGSKVPDGKVELCPIRVLEEKLLAGSPGTGSDKMNILISHCLKSPQINPKELLLVDRMFILYYLTMISYGNKREFAVLCTNPECKKKFKHTTDLQKFEVEYCPEDVTEPYDISLPVCGDIVSVKFLRGNDETEIIEMSKQLRRTDDNKKKKKITKGDLAILVLSLPVVTVNGQEMDNEEKVEWIENLIGQDADFLRESFSKYDFGVDLTVGVSCSDCGNEFEVEFPSEEFFRF